jgi:hypothetical protein
MTHDDSTKKTVLKILAAGLATQSEMARLADVDRQLVRFWCKREGIDPVKARHQVLAKVWNKHRRNRA